MKGVISLAFEQIFELKKGTVNGLQLAKDEDASLPCYFTPHFFAVETVDGLFVSNQPLTLRQTIALLEEKSYNYTKLTVYYSLDQIKVKPEKKLKSEKPKVIEEEIEITIETEPKA